MMCLNDDDESKLKKLIAASYAMLAAVDDELDGFEKQDTLKSFKFKDLIERLRTTTENLDYWYDETD
jgi:heme oxygenase